MFEPGFKGLAVYAQTMYKQLEEKSEEYGFLGGTAIVGGAQSSGNTLTQIMYFKSHEGVHAYANSPLHREAWAWYNKTLLAKGSVGIYHELYQVPRGNYETIYANMAPTGLATTMHKVYKEGETEATWMSPVVDARSGLLKTSRGRMSGLQQSEKHEEEDPYGFA